MEDGGIESRCRERETEAEVTRHHLKKKKNKKKPPFLIKIKCPL